MKIFNEKQNSTNTNSTSSRKCSYCRSEEHVVSDCERAVSDYAMWSKYKVPLLDPKCWVHTPQTYVGWNGQTVTYIHWYKDRKNWGTWANECYGAYEKVQKAKNKAKAKKQGKRVQAKCGFCGSTDHNRRNCTVMSEYHDRFVKANQVWRQRFYDHFVTKLGISVGAFIEYETSSWQNTETKTGIVGKMNLDELSIFCISQYGTSWNQRVDGKFRQTFKISMMDGKTLHIIGTNTSSNIQGDQFGDLVVSNGYYNNKFKSVKVRSTTPLDESWVEQAYEESIDFLTKRYSLEKLKEYGVIGLLEKIEQDNKAYENHKRMVS